MGAEPDQSPTVPSRVLGWAVCVSFLTGISTYHVFAVLEFGSDQPLYFSGPFVVAPVLVGSVAAAFTGKGISTGSRVGLAIGTAVVSLAAVSVGALVYLALKAGST